MIEQARQTRHKHIPERTCAICREKRGKRMLTRVVRTDEGLKVDPTGKLNGRGAYLCDKTTCWERAVKTKTLDKALRIALTDVDRQLLQQAMPSS